MRKNCLGRDSFIFGWLNLLDCSRFRSSLLDKFFIVRNADQFSFCLVLCQSELLYPIIKLVGLLLPLFCDTSRVIFGIASVLQLLETPSRECLMVVVAPWPPPPRHIVPGMPDLCKQIQCFDRKFTHCGHFFLAF